MRAASCGRIWLVSVPSAMRVCATGSTQFARIPCGSPSIATAFIRPSTPALAAV